MKNRIAVFPGSFDPVTKGHEDIIKRGTQLFDKIIVAIGLNSQKQYLFPLQQRMAWLQETFYDNKNIEIKSYEGLTTEFCKQNNAAFILRGLRTISDFEYEKTIAEANRKAEYSIESYFLITSPEVSYIHSSIIRELIKYGGNYKDMVPACVVESLKSN